MPDAKGRPLRSDLKRPLLGQTTYDIAKDAVTIWLPAAALFYSTMASIWNWPFSTEVTASVAAIVTFLGVVLKISSNQYAKREQAYDGALVVNETDPEKENFQLVLDAPWTELGKREEFKIKVDKES